MKAYVKHISSYIPKRKLTNKEFVKLFPNYTEDELFEKTGIRERGICEDNEIASDLAVYAAKQLFYETSIDKNDIDFIIFCTQSADFFSPTTACLIQDRLELSMDVGAYDINLGCTGFLYALSIVKGLIETEQANNILLLTCEPLTKMLHPKDKSSRALFGDAAAAILVSNRESDGIGKFVFGTDGSKEDIMKVKVGGFRYPFKSNPDLTEFEDEYGNISSPAYFYMKGHDVLQRVIDTVPALVKKILIKEQKDINSIDFFVFHQANFQMLEVLRKILKIPKEKFAIYLENTGNTVSSSIPLALKAAIEENKVKEGDTIMLVAFGVGFSLAATIIKL